MIQERQKNTLEKIDQAMRESKVVTIEYEAKRLCEALKIGASKDIVLRARSLKLLCEALRKVFI